MGVPIVAMDCLLFIYMIAFRPVHYQGDARKLESASKSSGVVNASTIRQNKKLLAD